jgi:ribosomal protein S18 acetylase RimI-like enzyme
MTSIPLPARAEAHPNLRALNALRDLSPVADLVELCFAHNMDPDGASYLRQMRHASRDSSWLQWAANTAENASSVPLIGYVWEEDGKLVGNISIINFRHRGRRIAMLANVAVHPNYRHRGIARALAERALDHARERKAGELWLHVRQENADALNLYTDLGFRERARRTAWLAEGDASLPAQANILPRASRFWTQQREWLARLHPDELAWYRSWDFNSLAPGLWNWLYLLFIDMNLRQWAALRDNQLEAVLSWTPNGARHDPLWLALGANPNPDALTSLLVHARRELGRRKLVMEHPVGPWDEAIQAAGFRAERTLIWMRADGATK